MTKIRLSLILIFIGTLSFTQETYNSCSNAINICPNETLTLNNIDADVNNCGGSCEDDNFTCFVPANSIWATFTTNATGGDVNVNFSNLSFVVEAGRALELQAILYEVTTPCDASTYTNIGNCENLQTGNFSINAAGLAANTTYYIMINGNNSGAGITLPAECTFDINVTGTAVDEAIPLIDLQTATTTICQNENVTLTANTTNCNETTQYFWYVDGVLTTTTVTNTWVTNSILDGDSVYVDIQCDGVCPINLRSDTLIFNVTEIEVEAGPNQVIQPETSTPLAGSTSAATYSWSPTNTLSDPVSLTPTASPENTTTYFLSATEGNCTLSDSVTIVVEQLIRIPQAFSPNNDGINDFFQIIAIENYPNCLVYIYDRWGQKVFRSSGYTADKWWNGEKGGRVLPAGTYFYVIELRDPDNTIYRGPISLIY